MLGADLVNTAVNVISWVVLSVLFFTATGELCMSNGEKVTECPNYKDAETDIYCCTSEVRPGEFFCCNEAQKHAQSSTKNGIQRYLPIVIVSGIIILCLLVVFAIASCYFCKRCPFYKWKRKSREASRYSSTSFVGASPGALCGNSYVPVNTAEPKPSPYEAPPPYPYTEDSGRLNSSWDSYHLENEENFVEEILGHCCDSAGGNETLSSMPSRPSTTT